MLLKHSIGFVTIGLIALVGIGCEKEETVTETGLPTLGTVSARVVSSFGLEDQSTGITLPAGLQVFISDSAGSAVGDALVNVWPAAHNPEPMAHQGNGRYEFDVLSDRKEVVESDYFFEVVSDWIEPNRVVLRVPHEALTQAPELTSPQDSTDHNGGEELSIRWNDISGADCYSVSTREHTLEDWLHREECITTTSTSIVGEEVHDFSFVRVRAQRSLGDEAYVASPYFSHSYADAQVRIFIEEPLD